MKKVIFFIKIEVAKIVYKRKLYLSNTILYMSIPPCVDKVLSVKKQSNKG